MNTKPLLRIKDYLIRFFPNHRLTSWITNKKWNNHFVTNGKIKKNKCHFVIKGKGNIISFGDNINLFKTTIYIRGDNNYIYIGDDCRLIYTSFYIENNKNNIIIGKNCSFGKTGLAVGDSTSIHIGNNCMFSDNISVATSDSHIIKDENGLVLNRSNNIEIGEHVWVCKNVTILKNGSIGNGCVIGANSLVTNNFSNIYNSIICGSPATIKKSGISWQK